MGCPLPRAAASHQAFAPLLTWQGITCTLLHLGPRQPCSPGNTVPMSQARKLRARSRFRRALNSASVRTRLAHGRVRRPRRAGSPQASEFRSLRPFAAVQRCHRHLGQVPGSWLGHLPYGPCSFPFDFSIGRHQRSQRQIARKRHSHLPQNLIQSFRGEC